ncbi:MAG: hypothetical protein K2M63_05605 [Muribaculaceae bacterium]|nr:hypothetical protein [Muribaculaceae bacterium]
MSFRRLCAEGKQPSSFFHHLSSEDVGCGYGYLRRARLSGGGTVVTKKAIIQPTTLLTAPRNNNPAME